MLMLITPAMQAKFPHCSVSWLSRYPHEKEHLFGCSADTGLFTVAKWRGKVRSKRGDIQHVKFTATTLPALLVRSGERLVLAPNQLHRFTHIKLEKNATLTTLPYDPKTQQGGRLAIHCLGACVL